MKITDMNAEKAVSMNCQADQPTSFNFHKVAVLLHMV